ncbi:MAG: hypothetical protein K5641_01880 [Lachnospiraceae bacterium]|nr:hypothetical protein [Lachnospiraceae bacterium]
MIKQHVVIKSLPNGISIGLDPSVSFETLCEEIRQKFSECAAFFKDAKVALSFNGRMLTTEEELKLVNLIREVSDITPICVIEKDYEENRIYARSLEMTLSEAYNTCVVHMGNITDRSHHKWEKGVLILGDVYPDCTVEAKGSIIVLGGLYGEAYAGCDWREDRFVIANDLSPQLLAIGRYQYEQEKKSKWPILSKTIPHIAYIENSAVVSKEISKEIWEKLPFRI